MSEERVEQIIGTLLRVGVMLAAVVITAGGVLYLWRHGQEHPDYATFHPNSGGSILARLVQRIAIVRGGRQSGLFLGSPAR